MKYIDAYKLIAEIERLKEETPIGICEYDKGEENGRYEVLNHLLSTITSLQQEQPDNMIQWTGSNLQEVIDFTGKSPKFGEWFKSWDEFESYVHSHGDILKLFSEDGSHYEVPIGAWIIKTPDGYNVPSVAKYIKQERPKLPGYDKGLLEVKRMVDKLYNETSIGLNEYDSGLYNGIAETCMKLRGFIKARLDSDEQPEVDLEKAARYVYESWMGGTMDDVRRDMVELGKVLNARKEK